VQDRSPKSLPCAITHRTHGFRSYKPSSLLTSACVK